MAQRASAAWSRRLGAVWGGRPRSRDTAIARLAAVANDRTLQHKSEYLCALLASPGWGRKEPIASAVSPLDRETYRATAAAVLREIERDIGHRAVTAGLVIGLNRNPLIDTLKACCACATVPVKRMKPSVGSAEVI